MNSAGRTNQMHCTKLLFAHWRFLYIETKSQILLLLFEDKGVFGRGV